MPVVVVTYVLWRLGLHFLTKWDLVISFAELSLVGSAMSYFDVFSIRVIRLIRVIRDPFLCPRIFTN